MSKNPVEIDNNEIIPESDEDNNDGSFLAASPDLDEDEDEAQCYSPKTRRSIGDYMRTAQPSESGAYASALFFHSTHFIEFFFRTESEDEIIIDISDSEIVINSDDDLQIINESVSGFFFHFKFSIIVTLARFNVLA